MATEKEIWASDSAPSDAARSTLLQMIGGGRVAQAVYVAARLNIADLLTDGPKTVAELANLSGTHALSLYRLMRALASMGLFVEEADHLFRLTPLAGLLCSDVSRSLRGMALLHGDAYWWRSQGELLYCVQTGKPAPPYLHGMDEWAYLARHPETAAVFNDAMNANTLEQIPAILEAYDFSPFNTLVDIGGGNGVLVAALLGAYPAMRGILFDQAGVVEHALPVFEASGVADRCESVSGDLFGELPTSGDGYLLKLILHDWDDDHARQILANLRRSMTGSATLLLVEHVILPGNEPQLGKLLDLAMLAFPGGRERTAAEWEELLRSADFTLTRIVPTEAAVSIIQAAPHCSRQIRHRT
jgi:O-methyltransferase domain/Dimerisation domain